MNLKKLVIATKNPGKYKEFQYIIKNFSGENQILAEEIIFAPEIADLIIEETGKTYSENAMLKATAWSEKSGLPCLADDSGLEVDALDGAPGLYSARITEGKNIDRVSWLLCELKSSHNRKARFVASLALCVPDEYLLICNGYCDGIIRNSPAGSNGFGYDPVFQPDGYNMTFAELNSDIKNSISHRANAFKKIISILNCRQL